MVKLPSKADVGASVGKARLVLTAVASNGMRMEGVSLLDDIVREGARRILSAAVEAEADAFLADLAAKRDKRGRRLLVRNGFHQPREVMTGSGAVEVKAPRVNDKRIDELTGERKLFRSQILPPLASGGRSPAAAVPAWAVRRGFVPWSSSWARPLGCPQRRLRGWPSSGPMTTTRFCQRDLSHLGYVYVWVDGIHINIRLQEDKSCLLMIVGVRIDGSKGWSRCRGQAV